ncbi:MAG: ShlB/FhaC/HecB family hemolysin secretion/activation protein [Rhodobacteraceae bacterium]|nr:ShlB/FhaC/HecB family hemolysin secretion/activation protein [Paracoccaceae bacterium]
MRPRFIRPAALCAGMALLPLASAPVWGQTACLAVHSVSYNGVSLFAPDQTRQWSRGYEGECLGLAELNKLLERVTLAYVDRGFITARAYLPEQDLTDGSLDIAVVEGKLADIRFNGQPDRRWQAMVFPGLVGKPVQIRRIEQGLDSIKGMNNRQATMEVDAGEAPGESILKVKTDSPRPWKVRYSSNTHGVKETGRYSSVLDFSYDHLLGLNDQWTLTLGKTMRGPLDLLYDGQGNKSVTFGVTLPYGLWDFSADYGYARYFQQIDGIYTPIPVNGGTHSASLEAKRLLHRDKDSKTSLGAGLDWSNSRNFIAGAFIDSSSRKMTIAHLELSDERPLGNGRLNGRLRVEKGLNWFGAEDADEKRAGLPNAQFLRTVLSATFERPLDISKPGGAGGMTYTGTFQLQYSDDLLYGGQQFAIGGPSTVRGVEQALARGSSGVFLRNELAYQSDVKLARWMGALVAYSALDYGQVFSQAALKADHYAATGGTIGLRLQGGRLQADLSYSKLLEDDRPGALPGGRASFDLSITF